MEQIEMKEQVSVAINPRAWSADPVGDAMGKVGELVKADELGALLLRTKYGDDKERTGVWRAVLLLAKRERTSVRLRREKYIALKRELVESPHERLATPMADIVERSVAAVLDAWLDDTCGACRGRGMVGGKEAARESTAQCTACDGRGAVHVDAGAIVLCAWPHGFDRRDPVREGRKCDASTENIPIYESFKRGKNARYEVCRGVGRLTHFDEVSFRQPCTCVQRKWKALTNSRTTCSCDADFAGSISSPLARAIRGVTADAFSTG